MPCGANAAPLTTESLECFYCVMCISFPIRVEVWIFVLREFLVVYSSSFGLVVRLVCKLCILYDLYGMQCLLCISPWKIV